ncbi:DNA-binding anti-repressor SinI [Salipaludibacillus sp. HK11]
MLTFKSEENSEQEWALLIKSALEQGVTPEEIRIFLYEKNHGSRET